MTELGRAYGSALYALAEDEKQEDAFLSQLGEVCKLLADNPDYVRLIKDKAIAKTERLALLDGAFSGQIHPYLLNFMKLLCERGAFGEMAAPAKRSISPVTMKSMALFRPRYFPRRRSATSSLRGSRRRLNAHPASM